MAWCLIVLWVLIVSVPVMASLVICAPKWWRKKVRPSRAYQFVSTLGGRVKPSAGVEWVPPLPVAALILVMNLVILFPLFLFVAWVEGWRVFVHRACPYSRTRIPLKDTIVGEFYTDAVPDAWEKMKRQRREYLEARR